MEAIKTNTRNELSTKIVQPVNETKMLQETIKSHNTVHNISDDTGFAFDLPDTTENRKKIKQAIKEIQDSVSDHKNVQHKIQMDTDSGRIQITLINYKTGETIEEIPSSKLLKFRSELENSDSLLLEEKV